MVCRDYILMIEQARDILLNGPRRKGRMWGFFERTTLTISIAAYGLVRAIGWVIGGFAAS